MQVPDEDCVWEVVDTQSMFGIEIHLKEELSKKSCQKFQDKGEDQSEGKEEMVADSETPQIWDTGDSHFPESKDFNERTSWWKWKRRVKKLA